MNVFEKAHELGNMLAESAEFTRLQKAQEAQSADPEASLVLMNYNRKREELIKKASEPGISNEKMQEIRNEMEKEIDKLNKNKSIAEFMEALHEFNEMMDGVNGIVTSYVSPKQEGGCSANGCSGDCGSCASRQH